MPAGQGTGQVEVLVLGPWDWLQYLRWACWALLQSGGVTREPLIKLTREGQLRAPAQAWARRKHRWTC